MVDIYLGLLIILALAAGLLLLALKIGKTASPRLSNLLAAAAVAFIALYMYRLQESALLARLLPVSNLIVTGNWIPLGGAFLAGLAWRRVPGRAWRKCLCVVPLAGVCLYASYSRFLGKVPVTFDCRRGDVCIQTSASSCSAAAAATLLKAHGIAASEPELAGLCFTRGGKGTTWWGLYRGLKLKTAGTPWDVEIFDWDEAQLRAAVGSAGFQPAILSVRLDSRPGLDPRFERNWGWTPGQAHAVVLFAFHPGERIEIGEPAVGREFWSDGALEELWHGDGMRLVRRKP